MTPMVSPQDAAKLLKDMGFTNVSILEGGTNGWKQAGLPTVAPGANCWRQGSRLLPLACSRERAHE